MERIILKQIIKNDHTGEVAHASMMDLRQAPGMAIDFVKDGGKVEIEKNGHHVASLVPLEVTRVNSDGTWIGESPLTMGKNLGDKY